MCVPSRYSDFSGAISSSLQRTQLIPKVERRLDTIVAMVASSMPIPDRINLSAIQIRDESFSVMQENFSMPHCVKKEGSCPQYAALQASGDFPLGGSRRRA